MHTNNIHISLNKNKTTLLIDFFVKFLDQRRMEYNKKTFRGKTK